MQNQNLKPVYLDNEKVSLMGDPKPQVSKVITASGKIPKNFEVKLLASETDTVGKAVQMDFTLDRTGESTQPIWLTSSAKGAEGDNVTATDADEGSDAAKADKDSGAGPSWPAGPRAGTVGTSRSDARSEDSDEAHATGNAQTMTQTIGQVPDKPGKQQVEPKFAKGVEGRTEEKAPNHPRLNKVGGDVKPASDDSEE